VNALPSGVRLLLSFSGGSSQLQGDLQRDVALGPQPP
jgi:hypothetical protein